MFGEPGRLLLAEQLDFLQSHLQLLDLLLPLVVSDQGGVVHAHFESGAEMSESDQAIEVVLVEASLEELREPLRLH